MRMARVVVLGAMLLAVTPALSAAQGRQFHVNFGGGPTFNLGDLGEKFGTGWGPAIGVSFEGPNERLGFQFEYAYRWFDVKDELPINATSFSANHTTHQLAFNVVANMTRPESPVRAYIVAGPAAYNRKVEITEYVGTGVICDPYYYVCGAYPVEAVLGSRSGWDMGFNIGGGIGFRIGEDSEFYVETRYHYVWGPEIVAATPLPSTQATTSTGGTTNGQYWPLTFGFRF
jgi:Outer membrane protein beta-barrel domain